MNHHENHHQQQQQQQSTYGSLSTTESMPAPNDATTGTVRQEDGEAGYAPSEEEEEEDDTEDDWNNNDNEDDNDDEDENETDEDDDETDDDDENKGPQCWERTWIHVKNAFLLVANVENLWDTPDDQCRTDDTDDNDHEGLWRRRTTDRNDHEQQSQQQQQRHARRRRHNNLIVLFWFVVLATSYAGERSTFKLLVDRAGPFRLFSVEMVTSTHAILLGLGLWIARCVRQQQRNQQRRNYGVGGVHGNTNHSSSGGGGGGGGGGGSGNRYLYYNSANPQQNQEYLSLGISIVDVSLMALLDTATLLLVFLTGYHVPPTTTVVVTEHAVNRFFLGIGWDPMNHHDDHLLDKANSVHPDEQIVSKTR